MYTDPQRAATSKLQCIVTTHDTLKAEYAFWYTLPGATENTVVKTEVRCEEIYNN